MLTTIDTRVGNVTSYLLTCYAENSVCCKGEKPSPDSINAFQGREGGRQKTLQELGLSIIGISHLAGVEDSPVKGILTC